VAKCAAELDQEWETLRSEFPELRDELAQPDATRLVDSVSRPKRASGMRILVSKRAPTIRYVCIGLITLVATLLSASSARSIESARELSIYCRIVERGVKGTGRHVYIPHTREALTCWGYMQAMQDLSVLADQEGDRIMGACPPEKMTTLMLIQLFGRYARAHPGELLGNATVAVFRALQKAYPCHSAEATGQSPRIGQKQ
jgi:Ssp1 endopeptidase immunity protein Rap1a